jgi:hypothetical protein
MRVWVKGPELADVAADLLVAVGLLLVPAGSEVGEPRFGAGEEVPADDEDGAGDGAPGPGTAEPAEPFAEERVGG